MSSTIFSSRALALSISITHGTKAKIALLNKDLKPSEQVIDLSIGTLDEPADSSIDKMVIDHITEHPNVIHEFAPVKGFDFLLEAISQRVFRIRKVKYNPEKEIMVTPGGIKGSITVALQTLINVGDEVIVPIPNWPHYSDMIELSGGKVIDVMVSNFYNKGLTPEDLIKHVTERTKLIILGDCVNPSGKIYNLQELTELSKVIAQYNIERQEKNIPPIQVLFDCPYESHIFEGPATIADIDINLSSGTVYSMKDCTILVTGPGKTYGMHGDRIGYICASHNTISVMSRVQVNTNSFASTYGQIATYAAMQESMDKVATKRALNSRKNLKEFVSKLTNISDINIPIPNGGFFIFADFTRYGQAIEKIGYENTADFLLEKARVATIAGSYFANGSDELKHFVRMNTGRSQEVLDEAAQRIEVALSNLEES